MTLFLKENATVFAHDLIESTNAVAALPIALASPLIVPELASTIAFRIANAIGENEFTVNVGIPLNACAS